MFYFLYFLTYMNFAIELFYLVKIPMVQIIKFLIFFKKYYKITNGFCFQFKSCELVV